MMKGIKEKAIRKLIETGKKNRKLIAPILSVMTMFLLTYYSLREFCIQMRKPQFRKRLICFIMLFIMLFTQNGVADVLAVGTSGAAVSKEAGSSDAASKDAANEDAASSDAANEEAGSNDAASDGAASDNAGSSDAASDNAGSGDAGNKDTGSEDKGGKTPESGESENEKPENETGEESLVAGFETLEKEIKEQKVLPGTPLKELVLPEKLTVYISEAQPEPSATPTASPTVEPSTTPTASPTAEPGTTPTASPSVKPGTTPAASPSVKPGTTPAASPTGKPDTTPAASPTGKPGIAPTERPESEPTAKPESKPTAKPESTPEKKPENTPEKEPVKEPESAPEKESESAPAKETKDEPAEAQVESYTMPAVMVGAAGQEVEILEEEEESHPDGTETALSGITWVSEPEYCATKPGTYVFTPELPDGYVLAEEAKLPEITVTVEGSVDYESLTDLNSYFEERMEDLLDDPDEEELEDLVAPSYSDFDVEKEGSGVLLTAGVSDEREREVLEYGFVWSEDTEKEPSLSDNDGMAAFIEEEGLEDFSYTIEELDDVSARAYLIFDGWVFYTPAMTTQNLVEDGVLQPMCYSAEGMSLTSRGTGGETLVYGQGAPFDLAWIGIPAAPFPVYVCYTLNIDREVDPNETVYLAIRGSIVGVPILDVNGHHIGELQSTANEEYYIIAMNGRDLNQGKNFINIVLAPFIGGWFYVDNMQLIFDGGPGAIDGKTAQVDDVTFQDYNFTEKFAVYALTVDGLVKTTNMTGENRNLVTSLTVDGNKMYSSQKYYTAKTGSDVALSTVNKCSDGILTINRGTLTLAAAMTAKPPSGSEWAAQDPDEVIVSCVADTIHYNDNAGPNEFRLDFTYDQGYRNTTDGPLKIKAKAQSVFSEPVSYIVLPGSGAVPENTHANDPQEGVDYAGQLKDTGNTAKADTSRRVYAYEADFEVTTNGRYEFKVVGPTTTETFYLDVTNIDNEKPTVEIVGSDEITILEDTPYEDLGFGGQDNRSAEDSITFTTDMGGLNTEHPDGGEYNITYRATDEAGNTAELIRRVHVANRPLRLATGEVTKSGSKVNMSGNIVYLGNDPIKERGLVWDVSSSPTVDSNLGSSSAKYDVQNKKTFTASASLSALIPNATYYCRSYAKTAGGKIVYGPAMSFEASDKNYGSFYISDNRPSIAPGSSNKTLTVTVKRKGGTDGRQTVYWRTVDGSAIADTHYRAASGSVTFNAGETSKKIKVTVKKNPSSGRCWEVSPRVFFVELYSVSGGGNLDREKNTAAVELNTKDEIQITNMNQWVTIMSNQPGSYKKYGGRLSADGTTGSSPPPPAIT